MSVCRATYQGDDVLSDLLAKHHAGKTIAGVRALLAGINAAATDPSDESWLRLVAEERSPALDAQLSALRAELSRDLPEDPPQARRVADLRRELDSRGLSGVLIPRADEHQGEYVPKCAQRLGWLTGFTGSAGLAVIMVVRAAMFVDGRYTLQVRQEVDLSIFETLNSGEVPPTDWLARAAGAGDRIGIDPWLHTRDQIDRYRASLARAGAELVELTDNPVDVIWTNRPTQPLGPVALHPVAFSGREAADKISAIATDLDKSGASAVVLTMPDSIAWLLNVRGADVEHTPLPLSFAVVHRNSAVEWYIDRRKLLPGVEDALGKLVAIAEPDGFLPALDRLGKDGAKVLVDISTASAAVPLRLEAAGATVVSGVDPCTLPKAVKNSVELDGTRAAHRRDGAALTRFLAWLSRTSTTGEITETAASDHLESLRRPGQYFRDLSFPTISGAGPNGAIVHYRASPATNRPLLPGQLYLVDSGAQYLDGTTDVTRTVAIGTPDAEQRDRFTRVLRGHIAVATAQFPTGTGGIQLDAMARRPLWDVGLDYDHGTGHGVGSYLSVHEGPHRIAKLGSAVALRPGMIVSNEPGYYKSGAFGIRIENLVVVVPVAVKDAERDMLGFETLTLAPFDRALIEVSLLTAAERAWVDAYHAEVAAKIGPQLDDPQDRAWLARATAPL